MNISISQSAALVVNAAAFAILDASDLLNSLVSRITGASVNRSSLAENVLYHATQLGLEMAKDSAETQLGMDGKEFIKHANQVFLSDEDSVFSQSVSHLVQCAMRVQSDQNAIPESMVHSVPAFATELVQDYVGKHAMQQLLGIYIEKHGWDAINARIEAEAGLDKSGSGFKDKLLSAGVRAGSRFLESVLTRATVDNPTFKPAEKPELQLAAGCLHAYLTNDANCAKVLMAYEPQKALIDEQFLSKAMDLTVAYAGHLADLAHRELARVDAEFQEGVNTVSVRNASTTELDFADVDAATDIVEPALTELGQAKKAHEKAWKFAEMLLAVKDLLVPDLGARDEALAADADQQRLFRAFDALFKNIPVQLDGQSVLGYQLDEQTANNIQVALRTQGADLTARALVSNNGLVAANILGTYAAKYGWGGLEQLLMAAVRNPQLDLAGDIPNDQQWMDEAIPLLTVRLAIAHLKPYIEQGDFNKESDPQYLALATLLHDNAAILRGDYTAFGAMVNSLPAVRGFLYSKAGPLAQATGNAAYNAAGYAASLVQAGAAGIGARLPDAGGLVRALRDNTAKVSTTTAAYAANALRNFATTASSFVTGIPIEESPLMVMGARGPIVNSG